MAFEGVSTKLQSVFKRLNSRGKLSEGDVKEAMREIKLALLEADVNFVVVKEFIKTVTDRAVGSEVLESLTPWFSSGFFSGICCSFLFDVSNKDIS